MSSRGSSERRRRGAPVAGARRTQRDRRAWRPAADRPRCASDERAHHWQQDRAHYAQRFAVVEPVFGNLRANKRLDRFTLRGRTKVDAQWKLYCLVHNIEKLAHAGYAA
ncbi:MAG: transposase [Gemmatimonas sp.]